MTDPLANVNRWRGELSLPAAKEAELPEQTSELKIGDQRQRSSLPQAPTRRTDKYARGDDRARESRLVCEDARGGDAGQSTSPAIRRVCEVAEVQ